MMTSLHWLAAPLVIVDNLGLGEEDNYQELASLVLGFLWQLHASTECSGERFGKICPTTKPLPPLMSNDKMMDAIAQ